MKNKPYDILYCNVNQERIENAKPKFSKSSIKLLRTYITKRYMIHYKKDILKLPSPWTDNYVLQNYKFTNIRREHDRTSRWLIENISENNQISYEDKIYQTLVFRLFNRIETAELLGLGNSQFFNDNYLTRCRERIISAPKGYRFCTNAYKTGGTNSGIASAYPDENKHMPILLMVNDLRNRNYANILSKKDNQLEVYLELNKLKGVGRFIAYQLYVDLTYINEFPFSENEFVVAGPGCFYGSELLLIDRYDFGGLNPDEMVFYLRDNLDKLFVWAGCEPLSREEFPGLPEDEPIINIMSMENILCEYQKFYRATHGISRPRNKYHPYKHEDILN